MVWEKERNAHHFRVITPHPGIDAALFSSALDLCASALFKKWAIRHGQATVACCNYGTINTHYAPNGPGNSLIHTGNTASNHLESQGAIESWEKISESKIISDIPLILEVFQDPTTEGKQVGRCTCKWPGVHGLMRRPLSWLLSMISTSLSRGSGPPHGRFNTTNTQMHKYKK